MSWTRTGGARLVFNGDLIAGYKRNVTVEKLGAHVSLCTLAYYVQWHIHRALGSLYESDGEGAERCWTFRGVVERLKALACNDVRMNGIEF